MSPAPATAPVPVAPLHTHESRRVLSVLVTATLVSRIGRGIFLTVSVLYFTLIVGLDAGEVAVILTASSAAGIAASFLGGWLADRLSARRLMVVFAVLEGGGLLAFILAEDFWAALAIGVIVGTFGQAANTTRMTILARSFSNEGRVHARAVLRTVTNLSIAVGSGLGAIALAVGTPEAYRILIGVAGAAYLLAIIRLLALPSSVDRAADADAAGDPIVNATVDDPSITAPRAARSPWRDRRYLLLTALSAVFGMQFGVGELAVPLWIAHATAASDVLVAVVLILNTAVVVCFQVPLSRGTHDLRRAGRVAQIGAWLMALACVVYALAAGAPLVVAVIAILAAALAHAFAEVLSQAAGWGLSFELADPTQPGAYQGVFAAGYSVGATAAPLLVAVTTETLGVFGWGILAAIFLASGLGTAAIARRAARGTRGAA